MVDVLGCEGDITLSQSLVCADNGRRRCLGFEAALEAAFASLAVGIDDDVSDFGSIAAATLPQLSAKDDSSSYAGSDGQQDKA